MKILRAGATALIVGLIVYNAQFVQAQQRRLYQTAQPQWEYQTAQPQRAYQTAQPQRRYKGANRSSEWTGVSQASNNSFDTGEYENYGGVDYNSGAYSACLGDNCCGNCAEGNCCGSCSTGGGLGLGTGLLSRPGQFYGGADYLNVRATFSESTAFVERTQFNDGTVVHRFNELDYDYGSSYRIFGGYRLTDCGGEIEFALTRFQSSGSAGVAGPDPTNLPPNVVSIQRLAAGELVALDPNTRIDASSNVDLRTYDFRFAKTIPLGSPMGSNDTCCDPCGGCPAWDIKWSVGVRFADVNWDRQAASTTTNTGQPNRTTNTRLDFNGVGPRWGLEGRRYIGKKGRFSLFAKGDVSLLLGDVNLESNINNAQLAFYDSTQIIPVLDIVAGGSVYLGNRVTLTSGYLFSAWQDLGMRDTLHVINTNPDTGLTFDDANILGFDGFFARAEISY